MAPHFLYCFICHEELHDGAKINYTMNGSKQIKLKQRCWARRRGARLMSGTVGKAGELSYVESLADNLFEPLTQTTARSFKSGGGGETNATRTKRAKMCATHSSSALTVNLFQYWQGKDLSPLLGALNLSRRSNPQGGETEIKFEQKFKISAGARTFPQPACLDVVIEEPSGLIAIETKFTEPYNKRHRHLCESYIGHEPLWRDIPGLYELARQISAGDRRFEYLDAAQLITHILGLTTGRSTGARNPRRKFKLLYLWYDTWGEAGAGHRKEIGCFAEIAKSDGVDFRHITCQEVLMRLANNSYAGHENYIDYLTERYL